MFWVIIKLILLTIFLTNTWEILTIPRRKKFRRQKRKRGGKRKSLHDPPPLQGLELRLQRGRLNPFATHHLSCMTLLQAEMRRSRRRGSENEKNGKKKKKWRNKKRRKFMKKGHNMKKKERRRKRKERRRGKEEGRRKEEWKNTKEGSWDRGGGSLICSFFQKKISFGHDWNFISILV